MFKQDKEMSEMMAAMALMEANRPTLELPRRMGRTQKSRGVNQAKPPADDPRKEIKRRRKQRQKQKHQG